MGKTPLVSIITPCYNGEQFLDRYFNAILCQTYSNIELIFVNDGSTDETEEKVFLYKSKLENKGVKFVYLYQQNAGLAAAINTGLKAFTGEYLTWPDCDDWMPSDMLEKQVEYLSKYKEKAFVLNKCRYISDADYTTVLRERERQNKEKGNIFEDLILNRDIYWAAGAVMMRSKCFLEMNPERDIFEGRCGQNYQMILPVSYKYECGFLNSPTYNILSRSNSHSRSFDSIEKVYKYQLFNEETIIETLNRIEMPELEKKKYIGIAKYECAKRRFYLAVEFEDREGIVKFYKEIQANGKITPKLRLQGIVFKSRFLSGIYKVLKREKA